MTGTMDAFARRWAVDEREPLPSIRGQPLDMSGAHDYTPPRRDAPLKAPTPPQDLTERLAHWRQDHALRLIPVDLDPPGEFLVDPSEISEDLPVRGRLHVPSDLEP